MNNRPDVEKGKNGIYRTPVDLQKDGLLWYINRTCFHPHGFALAIDTETKELSLMGNGDEPWHFKLPEEMENDLFNKFKACLGRVRV